MNQRCSIPSNPRPAPKPPAAGTDIRELCLVAADMPDTYRKKEKAEGFCVRRSEMLTVK